MPTTRRRTMRSNNRRMGPDVQWFLESGVDLNGAPPPCPLAEDLETARKLWGMHKHELMESYRRRGWAGHRPWAFWKFSNGIDSREFHFGDELRYLCEHGLLEGWEVAMLNTNKGGMSNDSSD